MQTGVRTDRQTPMHKSGPSKCCICCRLCCFPPRPTAKPFRLCRLVNSDCRDPVRKESGEQTTNTAQRAPYMTRGVTAAGWSTRLVNWDHAQSPWLSAQSAAACIFVLQLCTIMACPTPTCWRWTENERPRYQWVDIGGR